MQSISVTIKSAAISVGRLNALAKELEKASSPRIAIKPTAHRTPVIRRLVVKRLPSARTKVVQRGSSGAIRRPATATKVPDVVLYAQLGWDYLQVFLASDTGKMISGAVITKVVEACVDWAKKMPKKKKSPTVTIELFGPDNKAVRRLTIPKN